jgi:hypothetical protein
VYPDRYRLPQVTEHVVALLERRRPGYGAWGEEVESGLTAEAKEALGEVGRQFAELAEDTGYWQRLERSVLTVALPRYLRLAREHHELERRRYDLWRGGDLVSRAAYTLAGLLAVAVIMLTPIPDWLELLAFALVLLGPFLPDMQERYYERRYRRQLVELVVDMKAEQQQLEAYRPLQEALPPASAPPALEGTAYTDKDKEKT